MPTSVLTTVTDVATTGWTKTGAASTHSQSLDEGMGSADDATTYISATATGNTFKSTITALPGSFIGAESVDLDVRTTGGVADPDTITVQIFESDGTTAITNAQAVTCDGPSWASYNYALSIVGSNTAAAWTNAQVHFSKTGSGGQQVDISTIDITVEYNTKSSDQITRLGVMGTPFWPYTFVTPPAANGIVPILMQMHWEDERRYNQF